MTRRKGRDDGFDGGARTPQIFGEFRQSTPWCGVSAYRTDREFTDD